MRKLVLITALLFYGILLNAQGITTEELSRGAIGLYKDDISSYLDSIGVRYYYVDNDAWDEKNYSIELENLKLFSFLINSFQEVLRVKINYRHDNRDHLKELVELDKSVSYDKIHRGRYSTDVTFSKK